MWGIILAAGRGSRMLDKTIENPKCLLEVGGITLLEHLVKGFHSAGIENIGVVAGYKSQLVMEKFLELREFYSQGVIIYNPEYETTNNMYSLLRAGWHLKDGGIFTNGDNFLDPELIKKLHETPYDNCVLVDNQAVLDEESMKVSQTTGKFTGFSKTMPLDQATGEFCGIAKVSSAGWQLLKLRIFDWISKHGKNNWMEMAMNDGIWDIVTTEGKYFVEIDFQKDLRRANEIYSNLQKRDI